MKEKIFTIKEFEKNIIEIRRKNKKIVLCHGVFDLLHIGHLNHFNFAKKNGDILIVSITQDKFINKGFGRPVFNQNIRAEMLSSISIIDYIIINNEASAEDVIHTIKPNFYCKGIEYKDKKKDITKKIYTELKLLKKNNGKIIYSNEDTYSSSKIINKNLNLYNKKQSEFIKLIKKKISIDELFIAFKKIKKLKVLTIGEVILDQYIFSEPIGKSAKDTMLVVKENNSNTFVGGSGSIAKNISNFTSQKVKLISYIGYKQDYINTIKKYLGKKIDAFFIKKKNSPTILKKRYIDKINNSKLLGIYNFNNLDLNKKEESQINEKFKSAAKYCDLVIVNDFSHGLITKNVFKNIIKNSKFVTLNTQINSSNFGFHSMKNYRNLDCLSINERELRHELRDKISDIKIIMKRLSKENKLSNILVTRGSDGVILYNKKLNQFFYCEAFADNVLDKIGAGDTMHAIFSLCLKCKVDYELALLISSLAAARNIKGFANENLIFPDMILKEISHMIK